MSGRKKVAAARTPAAAATTQTGDTKPPPLHPVYNDFLTTLLAVWDERRLAAIMATLREVLTRLSAHKQECTIDFAQGARWPVPHNCGTTVLGAVDAADHFATELRTIHAQQCRDAGDRARGTYTRMPLSLAWAQMVADSARAFFMVLFFYDGRVRRLVMTPHRCHRSVWNTLPPRRERLRFFFDNGARAECDAYVQEMCGPPTGTVAGANDRCAAASARFVHNMRTWWVTMSRSSLIAAPEDAPADETPPPPPPAPSSVVV
jgi:hypothetical protein